MHGSIRIRHKLQSKVILRYFLALVPHTDGQLFHLLDFARVGATVEIFGLGQTSMIGFKALVMAKVDTGCDGLMAYSETVSLLCRMRDAGDGFH